MKRGIILITAVICGLAFCVPRAEGTPITIEIEGSVEYVHDPAGHLEGKIKPGDTIIGTYTYDLLTPDSEPSAYAGLYEHHSPPAGISLNVGNFNFTTDPDNVDFVVAILNDYPPALKDQFWIRSYNNLPLPNGAVVDGISWQLDDPTGTAISGTALPTGPPVLNQWESIFGLEIHIQKSLVRAHVTSAIPEPATLLLLGLGTLLLRKHN